MLIWAYLIQFLILYCCFFCFIRFLSLIGIIINSWNVWLSFLLPSNKSYITDHRDIFHLIIFWSEQVFSNPDATSCQCNKIWFCQLLTSSSFSDCMIVFCSVLSYFYGCLIFFSCLFSYPHILQRVSLSLFLSSLSRSNAFLRSVLLILSPLSPCSVVHSSDYPALPTC